MSRFRVTSLYLLYALPLIFLALFYFYPLLRILGASLRPGGHWDVGGIGSILRQQFFWKVILFTTWQAVISTVLTLALGLPLAYLFAHYDFPGKSLLRALTMIPFVMPTVVVAAAFVTLLGDDGLLNQWLVSLFDMQSPPINLQHTIWIILSAHVFYNVSVVIRTVGGFWGNLNPHIGEAAQVLGANRMHLLLDVTLPLLKPSIIAASLLVFLFCFTSFGVILILGGLRYATVEVEIYRQAVSLFNLPVAAFLSLIQLGITFTVMAIYTRMQARTSIPIQMRPQATLARTPRARSQRILLTVSVAIVIMILLAPLLALAWRSVTLGGNGFTLRYYTELTVDRRQSAFFVPPIVAIRNSLLFAAVTVLLSVFLGVISAYLLARPQRRLTTILDPVFLLPLGTSAVTLGFGYIISMGSLRTSLILIPIAHTLIAAPFVLRMLLPTLRSLDPRFARVCRDSGSVSLPRLVAG